jgi:adenine deaminase
LAVFADLSDFRAVMTFKDGVLTAQDGRPVKAPAPVDFPAWTRPMHPPDLSPEALTVRARGRRVRVIQITEGQLITDHVIEDAPLRDGNLAADPQRDLAHLVVAGRFGRGLLRGLSLETGGLASSVAHDSHNIVAAAASETELSLAVRTVADMGGGLAVVRGGEVLSAMPLPLAGLMTDLSVEGAAFKLAELNRAAHGLGVRNAAPFMTLSFLALPVIPSLRLTDRGLVDVEKFDFTDLFADEQARSK